MEINDNNNNQKTRIIFYREKLRAYIKYEKKIEITITVKY